MPLFEPIPEPQKFDGVPVKIVKVFDGDTVMAEMPDGRLEKIRLGVGDAPETAKYGKPQERGGVWAREGLTDAVLGQTVDFVPINATAKNRRDIHGRLLGDIRKKDFSAEDFVLNKEYSHDKGVYGNIAQSINTTGLNIERNIGGLLSMLGGGQETGSKLSMAGAHLIADAEDGLRGKVSPIEPTEGTMGQRVRGMASQIIMQPDVLAGQLIESSPLMGSAIAGTVVAGPVGGVVASTASMAGNSYQDLIESGVSHDRAMFWGNASALGQAVVEQVTIGRLGYIAKTGKSWLSKSLPKSLRGPVIGTFLGGLEDGAVGSAEEVTQQIIENYSYHGAGAANAPKITEGVLESGVSGGILEAVMGRGAYGLHRFTGGEADYEQENKVVNQSIQKTEQTNILKALDQAHQAIDASDASEADKEKGRQALTSLFTEYLKGNMVPVEESKPKKAVEAEAKAPETTQPAETERPAVKPEQVERAANQEATPQADQWADRIRDIASHGFVSDDTNGMVDIRKSAITRHDSDVLEWVDAAMAADSIEQVRDIMRWAREADLAEDERMSGIQDYKPSQRRQIAVQDAVKAMVKEMGTDGYLAAISASDKDLNVLSESLLVQEEQTNRAISQEEAEELGGHEVDTKGSVRRNFQSKVYDRADEQAAYEYGLNGALDYQAIQYASADMHQNKRVREAFKQGVYDSFRTGNVETRVTREQVKTLLGSEPLNTTKVKAARNAPTVFKGDKKVVVHERTGQTKTIDNIPYAKQTKVYDNYTEEEMETLPDDLTDLPTSVLDKALGSTKLSQDEKIEIWQELEKRSDWSDPRIANADDLEGTEEQERRREERRAHETAGSIPTDQETADESIEQQRAIERGKVKSRQAVKMADERVDAYEKQRQKRKEKKRTEALNKALAKKKPKIGQRNQQLETKGPGIDQVIAKEHAPNTPSTPAVASENAEQAHAERVAQATQVVDKAAFHAELTKILSDMGVQPAETATINGSADLTNRYWSELDERMLDIKRDSKVLQDKIMSALGLKHYDLNSRNQVFENKTLAEVSVALMLSVDIRRFTNFRDYYGKMRPEYVEAFEFADRINKAHPNDTALYGLKEVSDTAIEQHRKSGQDAKAAGIISTIEDFWITHMWDFSKSTVKRTGKPFLTNPTQARQRTLKDGIAEGLARGYTLKVDDFIQAAYLGRTYVSEAIVNRKMVNIGAKEGYFVLEGSKIPAGYKLIDNEQFVAAQQTIYGKEYKRLYAAPALAKYLNNVFFESKLKGNLIIDFLTRLNERLKRFMLTMSLFHYGAFIRSTALAGQGMKVLNVPKMLKMGRLAMESMDENARRLVRGGMTLPSQLDFDPTYIRKQTNWGKIIDGGAKTDPLWRRIDSAMTRMERYLFEDFGAPLKLQSGLIMQAAMEKRHRQDILDGKVTLEQIDAAVADRLNNDFGGIHTKRLGWNPTAVHMGKLSLLGHDWTISNIRSMYKALKGSNNLETELHRMLWGQVAAKAFLGWLTLNMIMAAGDDDDFVERAEKAWRAGGLKILDIDITPAAKLFGSGEKTTYLNLLGQFKDPLKFMTHPFKSARYKSSALLAPIWNAMFGKDYAGRAYTSWDELKKTKETTSWSSRNKGPFVGLDQFPSYATETALDKLPIPAQAMIEFARGQQDGLGVVMEMAGADISLDYKSRRK